MQSGRIGTPVLQVSVSMPANRSPSFCTNWRAMACWSACSTLTVNRPAASRIGRLRELRSTQTRARGGSSDTEVNELAVSPTRRPSSQTVVITVTPVVKHPKAWRSARASCAPPSPSSIVTG
jgi:hypothetical protein